jgi:membrane-bound lytic murein transglycosylase D
MRTFKTIWIAIVFWFALTGVLRAADTNDDEVLDLSGVMQDVQAWAQENLDTNFLNSLPEVDEEAVTNFFNEVQKRYDGDWVVDIGALKDTAQSVLPILENYEETAPYAAWLKSQLDYFEVADAVRQSAPSARVETNRPAPPVKAANPPPRVEREIWIKKVAVRPWPLGAREYVPKLKPLFAAEKIPPELVWLAGVESSFDRRARSPGGAAGMFQLMPDTAKRYGLSLWPRDQRYQWEPSAIATARHLRDLHDQFHDWRLTLAAYNAGEGRVQRLLERYHTQSYDKIATHLPAETQMYVPRVEATIHEYEGVSLEELTGIAPEGGVWFPLIGQSMPDNVEYQFAEGQR